MKPKPTSPNRRSIAAWTSPRSLGLAVVALAVLAHIAGLTNGFIAGYDDDEYVLRNPAVLNGLGIDGFVYALTGVCAANWHPLTMLSHLVDATLYGLWAPGHHAGSIALHALNALLTYVLFTRLTGDPMRSAAVAALFAVHPIHVESVAFISQRKDVLSACFYLLALVQYTRFAQTGSKTGYAWAVVFAAMAMLSKPMAVTLPVAIILLDYWPLQRLGLRSDTLRTDARRLAEKLPFIALAVLFSVATLLAQRAGRAIAPLDAQPLSLRVENALLSYVRYIGKAVFPVGLSPYYGYSADIPLWMWLPCAALIAGITVAAWLLRRRLPYLLMGWLWFTITLVPMIGLVQVGTQSMADRYAYITFIGLYIVAVWGVADLAQRVNVTRALPAVLTAALVLLAARAFHQTLYWRDAVTLWSHAVAVEPETAKPHSLLARALVATGDLDGALRHDQEAARVDSNPQYRVNVAATLFQMGRVTEAIPLYEEALQDAPGNALGRFNLGIAYCAVKRPDDAEKQWDEVQGKTASFYVETGDVMARFGYPDRALARYEKALELDPANALAHVAAGRVYESRRDYDHALKSYLRARELAPALPNIDVFIARARQAAGGKP